MDGYPSRLREGLTLAWLSRGFLEVHGFGRFDTEPIETEDDLALFAGTLVIQRQTVTRPPGLPVHHQNG